MIPRTKVNYSRKQLLRSLFIAENGAYRRRLSDMLQDYLGEEHVLPVPSGRAGLYFILKSIDKDRVVIPAYTCKAVAEAAMLAGKEVVHVEVEKDGFNMSMTALEKEIDGNSVVIATHQFGIPCDIERTIELARAAGAIVVEDAAPSLGSKVNGKLTGTFGDAAFYSFDSTKLITVPMKGGAVTVKDASFFERLRKAYLDEIRPMPLAHKLRLLTSAAAMLFIENHFLYSLFHWAVFSSRARFTTDTPEVNPDLTEFYRYDMADWQCFIACEQLSRIEEIIETRRRRYMELLKRLRGCRRFGLPPADEHGEWACIRFPIRVKGDKMDYYNRAASLGVDFAFSFTYLASPKTFVNSWSLAASVLDVPYYTKITDSEVERVARVLRTIDSEACHED